MLFNANRSNKSNDAEPERPKPTEVANHAPRMDAKKAREVTFGLLLIHSEAHTSTSLKSRRFPLNGAFLVLSSSQAVGRSVTIIRGVSPHSSARVIRVCLCL